MPGLQGDVNKSDLWGKVVTTFISQGHDVDVLLESRHNLRETNKAIACLGATGINANKWRLSTQLQALRHGGTPGWNRGGLGRILRLGRDLRDAQARLKESPPWDLTIAAGTIEAQGVTALALNKHFGTPYLLWEHFSRYQHWGRTRWEASPYWPLVQEVAHRAYGIFAVSPFLLEGMHSLGLIHKDHHSGVIPNPAPSTFFLPPRANVPLPASIPSGAFVFGSWTMWRDIKRLDLLLDAFALVRQRLNAVLLVGGRTEEKWEKEARSRNLEGSVLFLGQLDRDQVLSLAHMSHACVIPSDYETFGLPAIESLAAGRPVITTTSGGPEWVVGDSSRGAIVPKGDSLALADAMYDVASRHGSFDRASLISDCRTRFGDETFSRLWVEAMPLDIGHPSRRQSPTSH